MKYRIVSNGDKYVIQVGVLWWWECIKVCCDHYSTREFQYASLFASEKVADERAKELFGKSAKRIREWRVI